MLTSQLSAPLCPPAAAAPAAEVIPIRTTVSARWAPADSDVLAVLVAVAGRLDLHDTGALARLREAAHRITAQLVALGRLPAHLVVGPDDPDVVVLRTLAAAWRRSVPAAGE